MASQRTLEWRERNKELIQQWQAKMRELRLQIGMERGDQDKIEMEILQLLPNQTLREVFTFAKNYIFKYKSGKFRALMNNAYREILEFGTIEPSRLNFFKQRIESARRKMKWK